VRKALAALAATGALGLAAPAVAAATTFCVGKNAGGGFSGCSGTNETTIGAAITASHSGDTIDIGPGTYDEKPLVPSTKALTIVGSGVGQTVVQPGGTANGAGPTFNVLSSGTHVSSLTIGLENGDSNYGIQTAGGFSDIAITAPITATHPSGAYFLLGSPSLTDSSITLGADSTGISSTATGGVVSGVRITAHDGISLSPPSTRSVTIDDVLDVMTPGTSRGFAVNLTANDFGTSPTLTATIRHLTAFGDGSANSAGVRASATSTSAGSVANVSIASSIIRNFQHAIVSDAETICPCHATSTVAVDYTDLDTASDAITTTGGAVGTPSANINVGGHNINADPLFISAPPSAAPDQSAYHLSAGSPAIDAGDPAALAAGEPTTDLTGYPRVQVGRSGDAPTTDMGAFEFTPHTPVAAASASPSAVAAGSPVAFTAAGSSASDPGDSLSYSWHFDDGGTATGSSVSHSFSTSGVHTGTVTVTDLDGFTATASARVTVTSSGPGRDSNLRIKPSVLTKRGAIVSYLDSLTEVTRFTVQRPTAGIRRGHRCVKRAGGGTTGKSQKTCTLWIDVGSFKRSDVAGKNRFRFSGRLKHHKLRPGRYRLEAQTMLDGLFGPRLYKPFRVR
jgi:hypothetical protein